jgi:hypothetical protein
MKIRLRPSLGNSTHSTYASKTSRVVLPSTATHAPIPSTLMLASKVVFHKQCAIWPMREPRTLC